MEKINKILSYKVNDEVYDEYTFVELKVEIDNLKDLNIEAEYSELELSLEFDSKTLMHTGLATLYYIPKNNEEEESIDYNLKIDDFSLIRKYFKENNIKYSID